MRGLGGIPATNPGVVPGTRLGVIPDAREIRAGSAVAVRAGQGPPGLCLGYCPVPGSRYGASSPGPSPQAYPWGRDRGPLHCCRIEEPTN